MTFQTLDEIDHNKLLEELESLLDPDTHVLLQNGTDPIHDLPYTNSLLTKYNMHTSRIMCLRSKECYSWHHDSSPRIHFPIITNNKCFFVLEKDVFNMPVGNAYYVDTRKEHTAFNGNKNFERYHIVGLTNELV